MNFEQERLFPPPGPALVMYRREDGSWFGVATKHGRIAFDQGDFPLYGEMRAECRFQGEFTWTVIDEQTGRGAVDVLGLAHALLPEGG